MFEGRQDRLCALSALRLVMVAFLVACGGRVTVTPDGGTSGSGWRLGEEHAVETPVVWPVGQRPVLAQTPSGVVVAMVASSNARVGRLLADGSIRALAPLGSGEPQLVSTRAGVLVGMQPQLEVLEFRLVDPATGIPSAPTALPAIHGLSSWWLTGEPGRVLLGTEALLPDAGVQVLAWVVSDEGAVTSSPVDLSALGAVEQVLTGAGAHWVITYANAQYRMVRLRDDGTPSTSFAILALSFPTVAFTNSRILVVWSEPPLLQYRFFSPDGVLGANGALAMAHGRSCASLELTGLPEEVWATCATTDGQLSRVVFSEQHGPEEYVLLPGDGGALVAGPVATTLSLQLFERAFVGVGRGDFGSTMAIPLADGGSASNGAPIPLELRGSAQWGVGMARAGADGPLAMVWFDDRQLPFVPLLRAALIDEAGVASQVRPLPGRSLSDLPVSFELQRSVVGNGEGFVLAANDGFHLQSVHWPADGGPASTFMLSTSLSTFLDATLCAHDGGLVSSWVEPPRRYVRRADSRGSPTGAAVWVGQGFVADLECEPGRTFMVSGSRPLSLRVLDGSLRFDGGTEVATDDAYQVRLARVGDVVLATWEQGPTDAERVVKAQRFSFSTGAALDPSPWSLEVQVAPYSRALSDAIGDQTAFTVVGRDVVGGVDGQIWVWRIPLEGPPLEPLRPLEPRFVEDVAIAPMRQDGGVWLAYTRSHSELGDSTRVHYRTLWVDGASPSDRHPPLLQRVDCSTVGADGSLSLLLALLWLRRRSA